MRNLFKLFVLLFTVILLISSIMVGCNNETPIDAENPTSIFFWHYYKGSQQKILESQIDTFNSTLGREKGVIVEAVSMRSPKEIYDLVISSANQEPGSPLLPTLVLAYPDAAVTFHDMGLLTPYNDYFTDKELSQYLDDFLKEGKITENEDIYVFPISKSSEVLMVNNTAYQSFINEYNLENSTEPLDENMLSIFDGILATSKAYYEWTDAKTPDVPHDGKAFFGLDSPSNFAISTFNQLGDSFFTEVDGKMTINLSSDAFKHVWDHYYVPMVKGYFAAYSFYRAEDTQTGDLLMYIGSTGGASFFPTTVTYSDNTQQDVQLKVLPYPVHDGGTPSAVSQGAGIAMIAPIEPQAHAATLFLKWLTEPNNNTDFVLGSGYLPVTKEALNDTLPNALQGASEDIVSINVSKVIQVSLGSYQDIGFSTYKPFIGSEELRFYFEDMLLQRSLDTRKRFVDHLSSGHSYQEACDLFLSKSAYDRFVKEVEDEIQDLVH